MNQHDFIRECLEFYETSHMTPERGWEKAHYPTPKCLGGTETVWLTHDHHAIHGVLQSLEFDHMCFYPMKKSEREWIFSGEWSWVDTLYEAVHKTHVLRHHGDLTFEARSRGGTTSARVRNSLPSMRALSRLNGQLYGATNGGVHKAYEAVRGTYWWVNEDGHNVRSKESPGPNYQRGRKWKLVST